MSWYQYKALMFKNWVLWKRRLGGSLCELIFPILVFVMLAMLKNSIGSEEKDATSFVDEAVYVRPDTSNAVTFDFIEGNSFEYCGSYISEGQDWAIGLAPQSDITEHLADKFGEHPNLQGAEILYFEDNGAVEDYVEGDDYEDGPKLCFAVVFDVVDGNYYEYRIRFNQTDSVTESDLIGPYVDIFDFSTYDMTDETIRQPKPEFQEQYVESGFVQIQNYVDNYILGQLVGDGYIAAGFVPMKFEDYLDDGFLEGIADILPFLITLCFVVPVCRMISQIVEEKEYKLKEMMMIMGLSNRMYWFSWITQYVIVYALIALFATVTLGGNIFEYSNKGLFFLLFLLFGLNCIGYSLLCSVFFSRAKVAILVGLMLFLALFFVYFGVNDPRTSESTKTWASVIPAVSLGLGLQTIAQLEQGQLGLQADTLDMEYFNFKVQTSFIFLAVDTVLFFLLAAYFENVWPQEWGVKRPWNFLCKKNYWSRRTAPPADFREDVEYDESVEPVDPSLEEQKANQKAFLVRGLTKRYSDGTTAVDRLDLDIYDGQIFALLGHNGAGKTTTISMMTGLISSTAGDVRVQNQYLSNDLDAIRKRLGICPQQNVLWKEITVEEHLYLFCRFKGMTDRKEIDEQIDKKIMEISLGPERLKRVDYLSGGQKRKVQLAVALIGPSEIILLDEPTAGMDLTARRLMWDMLKDNKENRITILTTHYMQEADVLADRIAILSHGRLRCCGSSLFLKNRYGVGYYLTCVKDGDIDSPEHTAQVRQFIQQFIPDAKLQSDVHAELCFQLPLDSSDKFRDLFEQLDNALPDLKLQSYAVSATTLEEVFIRVARGDSALKTVTEAAEGKEDEGEEDEMLVEAKRETTGLFTRHLAALFRKRFISSRRDYKAIVIELLIPLVLVVAGISFMIIADAFVNVDPQPLEVDEYETPQDLLYPDGAGYGQDLMAEIDALEDTSATAVEAGTLEEFDEAVYEERGEVEDEIFRMGSYYFYEMDETSHNYEPVIFHNQTAFQSLGVFYQLVSNSILQEIDSSVEVHVSNHPLPITKEIELSEGTGDGILGCLTFALAFSFIPASIIAYVVKERETNVKHQHMISGASLWAYWLTNYAWDVLVCLILAFLASLIVLAFGVQAFTEPIDSFWAVACLFALFGLSAVPFTYCTSYLFKNYANAQSITIIFFFISGALLPIAIYVCYLFDATRDFSKISMWVLSVFPSFALGNGIILIGSANLLADLNDEPDPYNAFDIESAGGSILFLGITSILYPLLLALLEWQESNPFMRKWTNPSDSPPEDLEQDEDVEGEKQKALNTEPTEVQVNVKKLRKVFKPLFRPKIVAVEEVSFNVPHMECFALLGVNGAGKTTTFKMLTGEYAASSGEAFLSGYSVTSQLGLARQNIGYCPQFDALTEKLTCQEHIELYCEIKGINREIIPRLVNDLLEDLDLMEYRHVNAGALSGGNKRKLSVAIALIGDPTVVFLDEPTAGMDPETRKKLWKTLGNIKKRNSAVVLTTHSMEEAEALSNRMAIMVAGRLRCIGTPTHLRNKFGQGYELELKVEQPTNEEFQEASELLAPVIGDNEDITRNSIDQCLERMNATQLKDLIKEKGPGSNINFQLQNEGTVSRAIFVNWVLIELRGEEILRFLNQEFRSVDVAEHYLALFKFRLEKQENRSLGYLFSIIEDNKRDLKIMEYALSQTSLEQIFSAFAIQGELEKAARSSSE